MPDLEVVLPWRDTGEPYRRSHYWRLRWHYSQHFPVITGDNSGNFNRSAARNAGVAQSTADVVAIIDADNLISPLSISAAAVMAQRSQRLVKPFSQFGYLDRETTDTYYATNNVPRQAGWETIGLVQGFTGGAYVLRRDMWDKVGGFDEAFVGWGGEDDAFHIQAERTLGPVLVVPGTNYHLWHPTTSRRTSKENLDYLMNNYVNKGGQ